LNWFASVVVTFARSATPLYPYCCGSGAEQAAPYQVVCPPLTCPARADSPAVQLKPWLFRPPGQVGPHGAASCA